MVLAASLMVACSGDMQKGAKLPRNNEQVVVQLTLLPSRWVIQRPSTDVIEKCIDDEVSGRICLGKDASVYQDRAPYTQLLSQYLRETVTDIFRGPSGVLLLGASGTTYELASDASHIKRARSPNVHFRKTAHVADQLLAIDENGLLHQSRDWGTSYSVVSSAPQELIDLAADHAGRVALLGLPEQLYVLSDSEPMTWVPLKRSSRGVTALRRDRAGQIRAYAVLGEPELLFAETAKTDEESSSRLHFPLATYLNASDFIEGRVAELPDESIVLRKTPTGYVGYRGRIGRPLIGPWKVAGVNCDTVRLAVAGDSIVALCGKMQPGSGDDSLSIFESRDGAHRFVQVPSPPISEESNLLVLGHATTRSFYVSGACISEPDERTESWSRRHDKISECSGNAVYRVTLPPLQQEPGANSARHRQSDSEGRTQSRTTFATFSLLRLPPLAWPPSAMAGTPSGGELAIVAPRVKGNTLSLFRSRDGGQSFQSQALPLREMERSVQVSEMQKRWEAYGHRAPQFPTIASLSLSEDGTAVIVAKQLDHPELLTIESDGSVRAMAHAPAGVSQLSATAYGALAVSLSESRIYESTDGGAEFLPIATRENHPVCASKSCDVVCRGSDCVIGDTLARLGFGEGRMLVAPFDVVAEKVQPEPQQPSGRFECRIAATGYRDFSHAGAVPNALTAGFSDLSFYWLSNADEKLRMRIARAKAGSSELTFQNLFTNAYAPTVTAYSAIREKTGWSVAQVQQVGGPSDSLGPIEVHWEDLVSEQRGHVKIHVAEPVAAQVSMTHVLGLAFSPQVMQPVGDSWVLELGASRETSESVVAYVASSSGRSRALRFAPFPVPISGESHYAFIDGKWSRLALDDRCAVLLEAREDASEITARTMSTAAACGRQPSVWLGHVGRELGIFEQRETLRFRAIAASLSHLEGPSGRMTLEGPGQLAPCTREQRLTGQRYVVRGAHPEHANLDVGEGEAMRLLLGRWVLYRTPSDTCWVAVEASDESRQWSALFFADPAQRSVVFRPPDATSKGKVTRYGWLDCGATTTSVSPVTVP